MGDFCVQPARRWLSFRQDHSVSVSCQTRTAGAAKLSADRWTDVRSASSVQS